jgi:hypothetical protein
MLRQLLRREIEPHPDQLRLLVSAIMLGGNVTVAAGKTVGGDFRETPLCTERAQVGCVVAYSTFAMDPPANARFGKSAAPPADNPSTLPGGPGYQIACTDPRPLAGITGPLRLLVPSKPFAPGPIAAGVVVSSDGLPPAAPTTWVEPPDRFDGGCRTINGAHVLRYDPVGPQSRRPLFFPEPTWGTHLLDVNLGLDPLVSFVGQEADRWTHPDVRLERRCVPHGGLRVAVAGRDAGFVSGVAFKVGRRVLARGDAGGLVQSLGSRSLRRAGGTQVRAIAQLRYGAPQQLALRRSLPHC